MAIPAWSEWVQHQSSLITVIKPQQAQEVGLVQLSPPPQKAWLYTPSIKRCAPRDFVQLVMSVLAFLLWEFCKIPCTCSGPTSSQWRTTAMMLPELFGNTNWYSYPLPLHVPASETLSNIHTSFYYSYYVNDTYTFLFSNHGTSYTLQSTHFLFHFFFLILAHQCISLSLSESLHVVFAHKVPSQWLFHNMGKNIYNTIKMKVNCNYFLNSNHLSVVSPSLDDIPYGSNFIYFTLHYVSFLLQTDKTDKHT